MKQEHAVFDSYYQNNFDYVCDFCCVIRMNDDGM